MRLSWNEIRVRAKSFADDWSDATYEKTHKSEEAKTMIASFTLSSIRSFLLNWIPAFAGMSGAGV